MKLKQLLEGVPYQGEVGDIDITDVSCDSRQLTSGSAFVCIKGVQTDGHDYVNAALSKGVQCIVCQRDLGLKNQILVENSHYAYAKMCANLAGNPASKLKIIGVTGTNGKTTVTSIIKTVLQDLGFRVGLIGTIQIEIGDRVLPTTKTTPDAEEYQGILQQMVQEECDYVVMEVSSHALDQCRMADTHFDVAVFTNLTQDHLDYHHTMDAYFDAKKKLFLAADCAVINLDDPYGKQLIESVPCEVVTYSAEDPAASCYASHVQMDLVGVDFHLTSNDITGKVHFSTPGLFSVRNVLAAVSVCLKLGVSFSRVVESVNHCGHVKGRSEVIPTDREFTVICDYAHTPDGLENICQSINQYKQGRLIVLFGCGGDRDRQKRPIMGEIAARYGDYLIVTSDNPRTEDPEAIIDEILPGVEKHQTPFVRICDRIEAIRYAISHAQKNDVILLAGKGHEDYQVIGTKKIHLDEREVVADALKELK